jgi:hypothetical protein
MKTIMTTTAVAALLWAGTGSAQAAASATEMPTQDQLRTRDQERDPTLREGDGTPDRIHAQARDGSHEGLAGSQDRIRARAHDRMHEALAEHATVPPNAPDLPLGAAGAQDRDRDRDRDRLHEAEAVRAAERHLARTRAGEAGQAHRDGAGHADPGTRMGAGAGAGECGEAAGQRRLMEMHGGSMERGGEGDAGTGGPGGHR